jgi:hypothetical protein
MILFFSLRGVLATVPVLTFAEVLHDEKFSEKNISPQQKKEYEISLRNNLCIVAGTKIQRFSFNFSSFAHHTVTDVSVSYF